MGDAESGPIQLSFNPQLRVEFRGATVTSDAGLLLPRELDERLGVSALIERLVFNPEGDCLVAKLRPGNVHSAEGWDEVLLPIIDRYRRRRQRVVVRAGAAFARPEVYEALERRGVHYAIRLPANDVLERQVEDLLTRPRGRPSHAPLVRYRSFQYQAASWDRTRRVIAKIEHHLGELFPRVGFIVSTLTGTNRAVVRFYNQRGTAERHRLQPRQPATSAGLAHRHPGLVAHESSTSGCSRPAGGSSGTLGTSRCSSPKAT